MDERWRPIESAPRDGTRIDVLCRSGAGFEVIVYDLVYARHPLNGKIVLKGTENVLSPYLTPLRWRPTITTGMTKQEKQIQLGKQT